MSKRKSLILITTIIVSFILIGCNATLEQSNENKLKDTDNKVVSKNSVRSEDNQLMKNDINRRENTIDHIHLVKNESPINTRDISSKVNDKSTDKNIVNSIVIPNNDKPVDNLKFNANEFDNEVIPKQPIIKDEPITEDKHIESEPHIDKMVKPEENIMSEVIEEDDVLCENAWFDESKPCNYIPDNLKPTDELGRSVPYFYTSEKAWNWGELQIEDENSNYGCRGFSRMDGYQNDGTQFFFAYLKVCDIN